MAGVSRKGLIGFPTMRCRIAPSYFASSAPIRPRR